MPGYINLLKFTPKALADLKGSPERVNQAKAAAEKMGIRWVGFWSTVGEYDAIVIIDAPNDEAASAFALAQAQKGYVATQGMRAYSEAEWAALVKKLP
jgi:uncharacterized protein with GYD domain